MNRKAVITLKIKTVNYFSCEAIRGIFRNRLMSLAAVGTITMALLLFGGFYLITSNIHHLGKMAKGQIEIRVFLTQSAPGKKVMEKRLAAIPGVQKVRYVSKEEGAKILSQLLGGGELFLEGENPLPDSFNIQTDDGSDIDAIAARVRKISGVEEVVYGQKFVKFLNLILRLLWLVGTILILLAIFAVLYIMINTIQLTVYARRKEIEIMKLVGATDWFIRWPFLLEGVYLGITGAAVSIFILIEGYTILYGKAKSITAALPLLNSVQITTDLVIFLLAMGVFFGAFGSVLSIRRYLKV